jgi:hypothetical protein
VPIRKSQRAKYPADWPAISYQVKVDQGWRCAGSPAFPTCRAVHGHPHPVTGSIVVLTTAHLDHDPANIDRANLRAWCQRCHLTYDAKEHAKTAKATRRDQKQTRELFGDGNATEQ